MPIRNMRTRGSCLTRCRGGIGRRRWQRLWHEVPMQQSVAAQQQITSARCFPTNCGSAVRSNGIILAGQEEAVTRCLKTEERVTIMQKSILVRATWDSEASVWVAESDDVPGLATEAGSLDALLAK